MNWILLTAAVAAVVSGTYGYGTVVSMVKNVQCTADSMQIEMNENSTFIKQLSGTGNFILQIVNSSVTHTSCNLIGHGTKSSTFKLTYATCGIALSTILGSNYEPISYYTTQNFTVSGTNGSCFTLPCNTTTPPYEFSVYCQLDARASLNVSTNSTGNGGGGGGGGGTVIPTNALSMSLVDIYGLPAPTAYLGQLLTAKIELINTTIYKADMPVYCNFYQGGMPLNVIEYHCPNDKMIASFPYLLSVVQRNTSYEITFKAWTVQNANGLLFLECDILLCINATLCNDTCWGGGHQPHLVFAEALPKSASDSGYILTRKTVITNIKATPTLPPALPTANYGGGTICMAQSTAWGLYIGLGLSMGLFFLLLASILCLFCGCCTIAGLGAYQQRPHQHHCAACETQSCPDCHRSGPQHHHREMSSHHSSADYVSRAPRSSYYGPPPSDRRSRRSSLAAESISGRSYNPPSEAASSQRHLVNYMEDNFVITPTPSVKQYSLYT